MPHESFSRLQDRMQIFKRRILRKRPYICHRCKKIKFDPGFIFSTHDFDEPVAKLKSYGEDAVFKDDCAMCHALKSISPASVEPWFACHMPNIAAQFDMYPISIQSMLQKRLISTRWLIVSDVNHDYFAYSIYSNTNGFLAEFTEEHSDIPGPRVNHIDRRDVPYGKIRGWIDACMIRHTSICTETPTFNHHLNLIDCHTRLIVDWKPGFRFSALSYVWGVQNDGSSNLNGERLPPSLPQTIEDAITVSTQLGIHYLWVDKYCIRDSGEHKAEQIRNMHNIYRGAEITIIAVAGTDPYYGLPGVHSNRPRIPQTQVSFKGHNLISTGRGLKFLLRKSGWARRGWTLQEGLLSRRRLFFTDEQVFFECDKFHCCESLELLPLDRHKEILGVPSIKDKEPELSPYRSIERKCYDIYSILSDYTTRQLSHDDDILDAARGVLAYFEDQHPQTFRHLWGLPFFLDADTDSIAKCLTSSLLWATHNPCKRREGFPSWSWSGWKGAIGLEPVIENYSQVAEVRIELDDGRFISSIHGFRDLVRYREISRSISQFLVIKADTVDIDIIPRGLNEDWIVTLLHPDAKNCVTQPSHHDLDYWAGDFMHGELSRAILRLRKKFDPVIWKGLILQTRDHYVAGSTISVVLVVHKVKDWWERVGVAKFRNMKKSPRRLVDYVSGPEEVRLG